MRAYGSSRRNGIAKSESDCWRKWEDGVGTIGEDVAVFGRNISIKVYEINCFVDIGFIKVVDKNCITMEELL